MSRYPDLRFGKFLFFAQFCIKFWESYQIWGKLAQEQKVTDKTNWGWKTVLIELSLLIGLSLVKPVLATMSQRAYYSSPGADCKNLLLMSKTWVTM